MISIRTVQQYKLAIETTIVCFETPDEKMFITSFPIGNDVEGNIFSEFRRNALYLDVYQVTSDLLLQHLELLVFEKKVFK